jgi:hypothetical protein
MILIFKCRWNTEINISYVYTYNFGESKVSSAHLFTVQKLYVIFFTDAFKSRPQKCLIWRLYKSQFQHVLPRSLPLTMSGPCMCGFKCAYISLRHLIHHAECGTTAPVKGQSASPSVRQRAPETHVRFTTQRDPKSIPGSHTAR